MWGVSELSLEYEGVDLILNCGVFLSQDHRIIGIWNQRRPRISCRITYLGHRLHYLSNKLDKKALRFREYMTNNW